jgi:lysophospholipase L1-like esterase
VNPGVGVGARERRARLALVAGATAFSLLLAEGMVRTLGWPKRIPGWARIANTKGAEVKPGTLALVLYPDNPRGYFDIDLRRPDTWAHYKAQGMRRMEEFARTRPFAVENRYNTMVFRGGEFPPARPRARRVVVIGDSFTEGWGVREDDAYPRVLEGLLNAAEPGSWEVLNCGRSNSDFPALYTSLFKRVLALEPDLVVYGMVLNDPVQTTPMRSRRPSAYDWMGGHELPGEESAPVWARSRLLALARQRWESYRLGQATTEWYLDLFGESNAAGWQETKGYIGQMNEEMRRRRGRFLLALWPLSVGLEGHYPFATVHEKIAAFCAGSGIPFHDLLPKLKGRQSLSLWVHPVIDMHPNEVAHRLAAESLAPVVLGMGGDAPLQPPDPSERSDGAVSLSAGTNAARLVSH